MSRPSSVTTTRSSIRTPNRPGMYTPGSTVSDVAGRQHRLRGLRQPWRFVDLEPDAVAEPVAEVLSRGPRT